MKRINWKVAFWGTMGLLYVIEAIGGYGGASLWVGACGYMVRDSLRSKDK